MNRYDSNICKPIMVNLSEVDFAHNGIEDIELMIRRGKLDGHRCWHYMEVNTDMNTILLQY